MDQRMKREEILLQVRRLAEVNGGVAPGLEKFTAETGIKRHVWAALWRTWGDVLAEAGYPPNAWIGAYSDAELIGRVVELARQLGRFPNSIDLRFEGRRNQSFPNAETIRKRWSMLELAQVVGDHCNGSGDAEIEKMASGYIAQSQPKTRAEQENGATEAPEGFVYLQRHGSDYKIGFTKSLNKRGRQIQLELPQEIELVHSILTDDPVGVEAYWHKRFAEKRTRGEWFKLSKADVGAFKKWTKIW